MIPFAPPYITKDVISEVVDSLESGWITTGPKVKKLEEEIGKLIDIPNVLCVNSWTSGAILALIWLELKPGDEVIIPAYTYSATALAVIHAGGTPVMVDVGEDFNMDMDKIKAAITNKTKAIMPVDFGGYPCDYIKLQNIVQNKDVLTMFEPSSLKQSILNRILIISDAAHSFGATYNLKLTGNNADICVFSLHAVKNITTAEGGAIVINLPSDFDNNEVYKEMKLMSLNCQTKDAFSKAKAGNWKYDIVGLGLKVNMPDLNAAIGIAQLKEFNFISTRRKEIFLRYVDGFEKHNWATIPTFKSEDAESSYHLFALRVNTLNENQRDTFIELITKANISVNVHFIPLPLLTYFKELGYNIDHYPIAYKNYSTEISLPIYPQLTDDNVTYIIETITKLYMDNFN